VSSILQTLAMCFNNNVIVTFELIAKENQMLAVFSDWLGTMDTFKREPELRRIIFGLNAILRMQNPESLPQEVKGQIGVIGLELSKLCVRVDTVRRKTLK